MLAAATARTTRHLRAESSQIKYRSGATRPRGDHPDPELLLPSSFRGLSRGLVDPELREAVGGASARRPATVTGPAAGS